MWAQDECVDILVESYNSNIKHTWGGTSINGLMGIFDHYSTTNTDASETYQAWVLFGDPSMMLRTKTPQAMTVTHNGTIAPTGGTYSVSVSNGNGTVATITDANHNILGKATVSNGTANVNISGTLTVGTNLTLCVFGYNKVTYLGTISVVGGTEYTIAANVSPANSGTVTGAGTYYENTECTLTATANHGYAFDNWKQGNNVVSTEPTYTFTVTGNATYTANFHALTQHHLTYNPNQTNGTISVSPTDAYAGDIITLTATPAAGYCLDQWHVTTGRAEVPVVNNQFTMPDSDVTITATFKSGYTVTVATVANGTITATPTSALNGETITLTATPNTGCEFSTWYVYKTGDPNTLVAVVNNTFTMPSYDVTVSAVFATTSTGDVTIGSGTATNNGQYLPTYTYYNYSLTQQIYTVAEVGEAGTITAIAFQVGNSKAATRDLDIYMIPTAKDAFTSTTGWEVMSSVFKVYSGSVSFNASGWTTITLDTPYEYDGVKNLCVGVVDNTGSYLSSGNYPYFLTYSTSANRAMRVYNDDNAYSVGTSQQISSYTGTYVTSNNQVKFTKVLKNAESLTLSPESINDFSYLMGMGPSDAEAVNIIGTDLSNDITVTAPTNFEVSTSATGTYSSSVIIPRATGSRGDRTVTSWGFEGSLDNWTAIDSDGDGYGWVLGSATSGVYLESGSNVTDQVSGHNSSTDMMVSGSWTDATTTELHPDNWLVSPQVELGGSFSLWARPFYTTYFQEHFGIYVSTTSNSDPNAFTLLGEWTLGPDDWKQYSVDLHGYQGQNGYIAVRHFNGTNQFLMLVDDFQLDTDAAYNPEFPVTITSGTVYVRMKDNLNIGDYGGNMTVASGTLSKTVSLSGVVEPNGGEQYTITVNANPTEGGTVTGAGTYYEQSRVTLTATPATHYTFDGWQLNGSIVSTSASYQITVTGDATYTAVFTPMTQHNVAITQVTGCTITANPTTAYAGDVITLTASAQSGYFFVEWNVVDANNQTIAVTNNQFTMPDSNVTVTAVVSQGFNVTLEQTANGTISADQTTGLQPGAQVHLTATPDTDCVLLAWYVYKTGDPRAVISVVNDSYFIMPASDVTVQGIFVTQEEHEAQLGSGTSTNNYIPTYVRANYSLTQQIYLASELGNQKGSITKLAYYGYAQSSQTQAATRNLTIYISHTDKNTFSSTTDWEVMGTTAQVFSGNVTFSRNAWATITLDTPFEYDGESNINICVVDNTGSTSGSNQRYIQFYRYDGTSRALYANGSSSYANTVGYSNQLESTTGTRINYVNRINITMLVPGSAESLTVSPGEINDFSYVEGQGPSITNKFGIVGVDLSNDITVTAPTNFEISLTESGTYTSSLTIPRETGSKGNRNVTTWDFEDGLQDWTIVDADGDGYNWAHNTSFGGHNESTGIVFSQSYDNSAGALTPDNWLISPQVELGGSFSMWAKPQQAAYPAEHFGIYVSTTDANPSSFTMLNEWTLSTGAWKEFSVDLSAYAGQSGYIAVRHFNSSDQFYINVDDFVLDTEATITIEMPVTITPATVYVRMAAGLEQGTYSGTLNAAAGNDFTGSVSLAGEVIFPSFTLTIQGYSGNTDNYYLIASPIGDVAPTAVTIQGVAGANMVSGTYDLYYFDQSQDLEWVNYKDNTSGSGNPSNDPGFSTDSDGKLKSGKGYLYANSETVTLVFTGRARNEEVDVPVSLVYDENAEIPGWNLLGNPYGVNAYLKNDRSFYTMDSRTGEYVAVTGDEINPMVGIFVEAESDGETVTFTTTEPQSTGGKLALNLSHGHGIIDRAIVRFDGGDQLSKLQFRQGSTKVYIPMDGKDYAIVSSEEMGEMPVNFKAESNGTYDLSLSSEEVSFAYLHLVDNMTGADIDLLETPSYSFDARTTDYESRFKLVFATGDNSTSDTFAFFSNGSFVINNEGRATLQVIDVTGRILKSESIDGCANVNVKAAPGVYMLRLVNGADVKVQKVVVR